MMPMFKKISRIHTKDIPSAFWYWAVLGTVFVIVVVFSYLNTIRFHREYLEYSAGAPLPLGRAVQSGEARVVLDFGNGTKRTFVGSVRDGMVFSNVIRQIESVTPLPELEPVAFVVQGSAIMAVGGVTNSAARRWHVYSGSVVISDPLEYQVKSREEIILKYEQL